MAAKRPTPIQIDLEQFKLHLNLSDQKPLSLHFDSPSRRFYLSVIALVVKQMRENGGMAFVPLEDHLEILALLNETVGGGAGSSTKKSLLPRIYNKWKGALPDLENAPLFKVVGRKKRYEDTSGRIYRFDDRVKDVWANFFEYRGSRDKVRLRFSVEKLGIKPEDVAIVYGNKTDADGRGAWDRFVESLRMGAGIRAPAAAAGKDAAEDTAPGHAAEAPREVDDIRSAPWDLAQDASSHAVDPGFTGFDGLKDWLEKQEGIEKVPLKTRLEMIARLAMAPSTDLDGAGPHDASGWDNVPPGSPDAPDSADRGPGSTAEAPGSGPHIFAMRIQGMFEAGVASMPYRAPELQEGQPPSSRSEVYALGVLLYQLVVGDLSRPLDPDWAQAVKDDILREDIGACVEALPEKRLANPAILAERLSNLEERRRLLLAESTQGNQERNPLLRRQRIRRWLAYGSLFAAILVLLAVFAVQHNRIAQVDAAKKSAYETALPAIKQLLDEEKYVEAYALARKTEPIIPDDPTLAQYIKDATNTLDINTTPPGARISYRTYDDFDGPWVDLGTTPIQGACVPVGIHRWRIQKDRYEERELVRAVLPRDACGRSQAVYCADSRIARQ